MQGARITPGQALVLAENRRTKDRRRRPTPMISRYLFRGSRRSNRRNNDPQKGYYVDRPGGRTLFWVAALVLFGMLDVVFTYSLLENGGVELNPLINSCLKLGWEYCIPVKFLLTCCGLLVLVLHQNFFKVKRILAQLGVFYLLLVSYQAFLLIQL